MLFASNPSRVQWAAARAALEASVSSLEGLARSVLAEAVADAALDVARCLRESAADAAEPIESALAMAAGGDCPPSERDALEQAAREAIRDFEHLVSTAGRLAREVELRVQAAA